MKKTLSNPLVAIVLSALIIVASTLTSVHFKLGSQCDKVIDGFYEGVRYNGYMQPSLSSHLKNIIDYAEGLVTIGNNYAIDESLCSKVLENANNLRQTMTRSRNDISLIYNDYQALAQSINILADAMSRQSLSERDSSGMEQYISAISGAQSAMENAGYNESVRDFLQKNSHFPAPLFGKLAGVKFPAYFA